MLYTILLGLAVAVSILLIAIVFFTGKGDAMSGGSSGVRTTFKGKASFEDRLSRFTIALGGAFLVLVIIMNIVK